MRVAMQDPWDDEDGCPRSERVAAKVERLHGFPADGPRGRVKPHRFHHDAFRESQALNILGSDGAIADHFGDLRDHARLGVRMLAE